MTHSRIFIWVIRITTASTVATAARSEATLRIAGLDLRFEAVADVGSTDADGNGFDEGTVRARWSHPAGSR